ncbi:MAG TPA: S41 family peptidase, partial [Gammaproteobacteria bacterium]|nr:S41 family peptidase [Gammaproteobacteria bacterium]
MFSFLHHQALRLIGLTLVLSGSLLQTAAADATATKSLPLQELRLFTEIFAKIQNDYVEKIDDKALIKHAVEGMLSGLDPHSAYLDKRSFKNLQVDTEGKFGGLGVEITLQNGYIRVVTPIDDTPAFKAGIKAGDVITRIDGTLVKNMSLSDAMEKMRGEPGTRIKLQIARENTSKPLDFTITRAIIKITSVKSRSLEPGFGYVRITQFQTATGGNLLKAIRKLKKNNNGQLKGLVLDLRNNPGGILKAAIEVSDAFLSKGEIVSTHGRNKDSDSVFK